MKYIFGVWILFLSLSVASAPTDPWLERVPESKGTWQQWTEVPKASFFEVPASKLPTAEVWLKNSSYLAQENSGVTYFGRPDFSCVLPAKAYLIRAAYINGGTGEFALYWAESALVVLHGSLGPLNPPSRSALVVCLSRAPTAVFSSLSTAL